MLIRSLLILALLQLTGCAFFGHQKCNGEDCDDTPKLLEQKPVAHKWYCYGKADGVTWDCLNHADPSLVMAVTPNTQPAVNPDQVPGADQTDETSNAPVEIKSLLDITRNVMDEDDDHYTVQLTAAHTEKALAEYAQQQAIRQPVYIVIPAGPNDQAPTYILLLGIYGDQDKALDAKHVWQRGRKLPEDPWVRKIGPLKSQIKSKDKNA